MMRLWMIFAVSLVLLTSCVPTHLEPDQPISVDSESYPNLGAAPELTNEVWLNTDQPLHLEDLRGKVVLLDMWTFG
jgi:hypothetical protein